MTDDEKQLHEFASEVVKLAGKQLSDNHMYFVYVCANDPHKDESIAITFGNSCQKCCLDAMNELNFVHWSIDKERTH